MIEQKLKNTPPTLPSLKITCPQIKRFESKKTTQQLKEL